MIAASQRLLNQHSKEMYITQQLSQRLMQLQGECKIQKITLLRANYFKAIFLTILATLSIIGLLVLFYYKWFRVMIWFSNADFQEATHIYVQGGPKNDDIEAIDVKKKHKIFYFKNLQYVLLDNTNYIPYAYNYEQFFPKLISKPYIEQGLTSKEVQERQHEYGLNQHAVQIPNYFSYMLQTLLKPFFLLQYLICLAYFIEGYLVFTILNLVFSIITTSINYVLTYLSYKKIKEMAEKIHIIKVLRDGHIMDVKSVELVPGDLIIPDGEIMCDCILVRDEVYVNQASLTGESLPIGKTPARNFEQTQDHFKWLYQGSQVVEKRGHPLALVVYTGYATRRGRIIRKILTKVPSSSQIFRKALYFLIEAFIVSMIIYFATLGFSKSRNISNLIIGFRFVDFLGWAFPPTFPIYFNLAYSFAAVRLKHNKILCMQPDKTVQGSNVKILCFDKTGTLTQNNVQINRIYKFNSVQNSIPSIEDITQTKKNPQNTLIMDIFGSCHSTKYINNQYIGDEIDLRMFLASGYAMVNSQKIQVKFQVRKDMHRLQVLRINQFQSKFQSMSVLVKNMQNSKYYVFIKGAPQRLYMNSLIKIPNFDDKVAELSLSGYRTICFGYKEISETDVDKYLQCPRQNFQHQIYVAGLVAFQNQLKHDTQATIEKIICAGIQPKIITGDNIFIAVETGVRAGILKPDQKVILIQGAKQQKFNQSEPRTFKAILLTRTKSSTTHQPILLDESTSYLNSAYPIAIDNNFLTLNPQPVLTHNIKLFARISPQNKALIIRKYKQMLNSEFEKQTTIDKICGELKKKVGMCGDGSNDLIAIREADIGIGVNNSDASYAATFTINQLDNVDYLLRDSKATTTNIVEMIRYYEFISFLKIPSALLMQYDTTYFHQSQVLYTNFTCTVIYPILQAMSFPTDRPTKAIPNGNFLGIVNQVRFWGSLIIATGGLTAGYFYFLTAPEYTPNPNPVADTNWNTVTHTATVHFLLMLPPSVIYAYIFYISDPWKLPIYRNYLLSILIILNIGATVALHYITKYSQTALGTVPISNEVISVVLAISVGACIMGFFYNMVITKLANNSLEQNAKQHQKQELGPQID